MWILASSRSFVERFGGEDALRGRQEAALTDPVDAALADDQSRASWFVIGEVDDLAEDDGLGELPAIFQVEGDSEGVEEWPCPRGRPWSPPSSYYLGADLGVLTISRPWVWARASSRRCP